jgi:DNA-binding protein YbaB
MGMFDKLKDLKKLKDLDSSLAKERMDSEIDGVKVIVNGKAEIVEITLNLDMDKEKLEKVVKDCVNDACGKAKMVMARKAAEVSGLNF